MENVSWKIPKFKADANKAYEEISKLDSITPQNVVNLARNENSVLHDDFEWNDTIAGAKYRETQAREMIRMFVFTPAEEHNEPTRVFQITQTATVYEPVTMILQREDEYQTLLKRAKNELLAFKKRYENLVELETIFAEISALEERRTYEQICKNRN
jgi:hypothetical protein